MIITYNTDIGVFLFLLLYNIILLKLCLVHFILCNRKNLDSMLCKLRSLEITYYIT